MFLLLAEVEAPGHQVFGLVLDSSHVVLVADDDEASNQENQTCKERTVALDEKIKGWEDQDPDGANPSRRHAGQGNHAEEVEGKDKDQHQKEEEGRGKAQEDAC